MPMSPRETLLCRYRYDPLNRSIGWAPDQQASIQRFYCKSRLATEIQGAAKYSFLQHDEQVLAQQRQVGDKVDTTLLATDQQHSVLNALDATQSRPRAYSPYGHHSFGNGLLSLLGFNGERPDPVTGHYHLGSGYRQFNPTLMRFNSPDSWSPFGEGGLNAYMYCGADPINRSDPTGHRFHRLPSIGKIAKYTSFMLSAYSLVMGAGLLIMGHLSDTSDAEEMKKTGMYLMIGGGVLMTGGFAVMLRPDRKFTALLGNLRTPSRPVNNSRANPHSVSSYQQGHREAAVGLNPLAQQSHSPALSHRSFELPTRSPTPPPSYDSLKFSTSSAQPPPYSQPGSVPSDNVRDVFFNAQNNIVQENTDVRRST